MVSSTNHGASMRLTNSEKHELSVKLVSDYLIYLGYEHFVFQSDPSFDIYVPDQDKSIKIFCNYSRVRNIKVPGDFETHDGVLYLIVSPTDKNQIGFSCVGGTKCVIDDAIKDFQTAGSPKNIQTNRLKYVGIKKHFCNL